MRIHHYTICMTMFIALIIAGCLPTSTKKIQKPVARKAPPITIWVHGTKQFFSKFFKKEFFYATPGVHPITTYPASAHTYAVAQWLSSADPERFPLETFYSFGWNGNLSFQARQDAAQELAENIIKLRDASYAEYGSYPTIRIITHSHGGNVALHLTETSVAPELIIDELILLACPVQERTAHTINHPMFKHIYSIFSTMDSIQVLDPQGFHYWRDHKNGTLKDKVHSSFFSQRQFGNQENLSQIKVKFERNGMLHMRRGLMHIEFLFERFIKALPALIDEACIQAEKGNRSLFIRIKYN